MHIVQEPFNVNRVALAAGRAAVAATGFVEARRAEVAEARDVLTAELAASGFRCHPSQANFVLVELGTDDQPVCDRLASRGMLIRGGTEFGLPGFARITVAPPPVMRQAAAAVTEAVQRRHLGVCGVMVYQLTETLVSDRIAELLQREGAEFIVGFPENRLLNSASLIGMRPIITRTERVAVNIADGYARATNGERILPCVTNTGRAPSRPSARSPRPTATAARSSLSQRARRRPTRTRPRTSGSRTAYRPITRWAATLNDPRPGPDVFRKALNALRGVGNGPVAGGARQRRAQRAGRATSIGRCAPLHAALRCPRATSNTPPRILPRPSAPVIVAGQGRVRGAITNWWRWPAHPIPVATTLNGKSAFPENYPLSLGTASRARPATVDHYFQRADAVLGVGTGFTPSLYITPMPSQGSLGRAAV